MFGSDLFAVLKAEQHAHVHPDLFGHLAQALFLHRPDHGESFGRTHFNCQSVSPMQQWVKFKVMTPEQYLQQLAALGINRGALSSGFQEGPNGAIGKERELLLKSRAKFRLATLEDLSALNPAKHEPGTKSGALPKPSIRGNKSAAGIQHRRIV